MPYKVLNILVIATAVYILRLAFEDKLALYIHPRYEIFTIVLSVIGLVLAIVSFYSSSAKLNLKNTFSILPLLLILSAALIMPPRSLTSFSLEQRSVDNSSPVEAGSQTLSYYSGSSKNLSVAEWSRLLDSNSDPIFYANREVDVSGFVYDVGSQDSFQVVRFVVTCCTVDAQPTGLTVYQPNWRSKFKQDQWVQVAGKISTNPDKTKTDLVIIPESIVKIEEPDNPYAN